FPSISRIIPDIFMVFLVAVLIATAFMGFLVYKNLSMQKEAAVEHQKLVSELVFWQNVTAKHADYRDAYFMLAILEYRLGNKQKALDYIEKSLAIDPNFTQGREFEKILSN